jgi:hypothetical protein
MMSGDYAALPYGTDEHKTFPSVFRRHLKW